MNAAILMAAILPVLLVAAAVFDLTTYTIPNILSAAMIVLFVSLLAVLALDGHALSWSATGYHLLAAFVALAGGIAFFAAGWVGGGDAKLFATATLWLGWDGFFDYAILATLLGGGLTLMLISLRHAPLPSILVAQPWFARLADKKERVPYGVALALGALMIWPSTELFRLAATS